MQEVSIEELEATLKWFNKDESPGLDGWTIEFYLVFFELIGTNLLWIIEEYRSNGRLEVAITSTFISLILKTDNPYSFDEYWPISLSNYL